MNYFLDNAPPPEVPPKIWLPPSAQEKADKQEKTGDTGGDDAKAKDEVGQTAKPQKSKTKKQVTADTPAPFTLRELQEAAAYYLAQGMPPDTPVYITTADKRFPPRSRTAMIGLYPGIMEEAGQLRIEPRHPVIKQKQGLLSKILKNM